MAKTLFDIEARLVTHKDDQETSFEAAQKMVKSRALGKQEEEVYKAIVTILSAPPITDDFTAKEIASWCWVDYYKIQRRFSGLYRKGKIERTGERRDGCCVWKLKG